MGFHLIFFLKETLFQDPEITVVFRAFLGSAIKKNYIKIIHSKDC